MITEGIFQLRGRGPQARLVALRSDPVTPPLGSVCLRTPDLDRSPIPDGSISPPPPAPAASWSIDNENNRLRIVK